MLCLSNRFTPYGKAHMKLPEFFSFNQNNLQDYEDCEFRFLLKHVRQLNWPAVESEPLLLQEKKIEIGYLFHQLVQRFFSGMSPILLTDTIEDPILQEWWGYFLDLNLLEQPGVKFAEKMISVPFNGYRLVAKYDLLILLDNGHIEIYDWKTSISQPHRHFLIDRMQSHVYPALLMLQQSCSSFIARPSPGDISMTYWFPSHPQSPVSFTYSPDQYEKDLQILGNKIKEIVAKEENEFEKTNDVRKCKYCHYRSLCERGIKAGIINEDSNSADGDNPFEFDFNAL